MNKELVMSTREFTTRRLSTVSTKAFDEVVRGLESNVGRPDMSKFRRAVIAATTESELEDIVYGAIGPSELMEFTRFDDGEVLRKEKGKRAPKAVRLLIGNPVIMKDMAKHVPDAAAYAPVTILVDERADGVHLSYDLMESLLAPYESPDALAIAKMLDEKIKQLFMSIV